MAYIPGGGIKRPLNTLENPTYPDIRRGPPRFRSAGKHWKVDVGATLMDQYANRQLTEGTLLIQSRDYNKTIYGQSSHRDVVNKNFRPPLLDPIKDFYPLSRLPRERVIPRLNPGTAGGSTSGFASQNMRPNGLEKYYEHRLKPGSMGVTHYAPPSLVVENDDGEYAPLPTARP